MAVYDRLHEAIRDELQGDLERWLLPGEDLGDGTQVDQLSRVVGQRVMAELEAELLVYVPESWTVE